MKRYAARAVGSGAAAGRSGLVTDFIGRMTLEEKVGQMTQLTVGTVTAAGSPRRGEIRLDPDRLREALLTRHVGSVINILGGSLDAHGWHRLLREIQAVAVEESRLGIPVLYAIDHVHGANYVTAGTIFPHNIGLAAAFDEDLARRVGEVTGAETLAAGLRWNFAPVLDVGRQPLWPRFYETFGEATFLVARLGEAMIRGLHASTAGRVAATAKHYLGYGGSRTGRDRTPIQLGPRGVREQFLPPFRRAVAAGVNAVMVNSAEIDGEPVHASRYWLTDVLRGELGFDGVVVSDWADIAFLHTRHRVAPSLLDAARMAVEAGIDIAMTPDTFDFHDHLVRLVREGAIAEGRVDASVARILTLKEELGLFGPVSDGASAGVGGAPADVGTEGARAVALEASRASMTLLKNDGVLPLAPGCRVCVTGPAATSVTALHGGWTHTWQGTDPSAFDAGTRTLLDELATRAEAVEHVPGAGFTAEVDVAAAAEAAGRADVAIVALGEDAYAEWAGDIRDLTLPEPQLRLARAVLDTGTPTVLVLVQGRPRLITGIAGDAAAILMAYWPGMQGARAIAETLYGEVGPSGRLPFTYPRHPNDLTAYDHKFTETMDTRLEPRGPGGFDPLFDFGHGLGYTLFEYADLRTGSPEIGPEDTLEVSVRIRNAGERRGRHTVLLFTRQHFSRMTPHTRRLRGFRTVELEPGESRRITFPIDGEALSYIGRDGEPVLEPGAFDVMVGALRTTFRLVAGR